MRKEKGKEISRASRRGWKAIPLSGLKVSNMGKIEFSQLFWTCPFCEVEHFRPELLLRHILSYHTEYKVKK